LDGALIVSPRPTTIHQFVAGRLYGMLARTCPEDLCVIPEPAVQLTGQTEFDPDLVVVGMEQVGGAKFTEPPLLIAEVRSPSTALIDLNRKKSAYEKFGVQSYWIVDPDLRNPSLTAFELRSRQYFLEAKVTGDEAFRAARPFPAEVIPAHLVTGLRRPGG
jgi:Uma2 family endonuclease